MSRVLVAITTDGGSNVVLDGFEHKRVVLHDEKDKDGYRVTVSALESAPFPGAKLDNGRVAPNGGSTKAFLCVDGVEYVGVAECSKSDRFDRRVGRYVAILDALTKSPLSDDEIHSVLSGAGKVVGLRYHKTATPKE